MERYHFIITYRSLRKSAALLAGTTLELRLIVCRFRARQLQHSERPLTRRTRLRSVTSPQKLISIGFLDEATKLCKSAIELDEGYSPNIDSNLALIKELPAEEDEKEAEQLKKARPKTAFYRRWGKAVGEPSPLAFPVKWKGPNCSLTAKMAGDKLILSGTYEVAKVGGLFALSGGGTRVTSSDVRGRCAWARNRRNCRAQERWFALP